MKRILAGLILGLSVWALVGCGNKSDVQVSVDSVSTITGMGNVGVTNKFAGMVVSEEEFKVKKDSNLEVKDLKVQVGDVVKAGQVLFTYDQDEAQLNLEKLQLELEEIKNTITSKNSEKAQLEREKASASADEKLNYSIQIQSVEADIREADYNKKGKEQEVERAKRLLSTTGVESPVDGTVKAINNTNNQQDAEMYDEFGGMDGGQPSDDAYITIIKAGSYQIKGTINEMNAGALQEGMEVVIRSRMDETVTWSGMVDHVDWDAAVQNSNNDYYETDEMTTSSKYPFYVTLDSQEGLMLGQHVYVDTNVNGEEDDASKFSLPSYYIVDADSNPYVWKENSRGKLTKQKVELGEYDDMMEMYVIESGLTLDDYIAFPSEDCKEGVRCIHSEDMSGDEEFDDGEMMDDAMTGGEFTDEGMVGDDELYEEEIAE